MKFYFILIISLGIIKISSIIAMAEEARNLMPNGDFKKFSTQTFVYDGVDKSGQLDVGANSSPAIADIDRDGKKDLVVGSGEGLIYCYLNQGTDDAPKFTSANLFQPYYINPPDARYPFRTFGDIKPHLVDWDNDGKMDILFGTGQGWVFLLKGEGGGRFGSGQTEVRKEAKDIKGLSPTNFDIGTYAAPASIDWNGDGNKDLILGEGTYGANSVYIFLNKGRDSSPSFNKDGRSYLAYGMGREQLTPAIIDWDSDGDSDLIVGERLGFLNLYLNKSPPRRVGKGEKITILDYSKKLETAAGPIKLSYPTPSTVDWDNDGDLDLLSGSKDGRIYLFLNEGTGGKPQFSSPKTLKGEDKLASINVPGSWRQSYKGSRRNGVYVLETDESEPYSGKRCLKLSAIGDYPGGVGIPGPSFTLHDNKKYIFTFYAKGKDIEGSWNIRYSEKRRVVIDGKRGYKSEKYTAISGTISGYSSWRKVEKKFELPTKGKGKERNWGLGFSISGKGSFYLDKVSLQEVK